MALIETFGEESQLTQTQRWAHYLTVGVIIGGMLLGVFLRETNMNATQDYTDTQAGIQARYPRNWLIDFDGDYIFRVRDMTYQGFKTTMQVSTRVVSPSTSERSILDSLSLNRAQTLTDYSVLAYEPFPLRNEVEATAMFYTFVSRETNPLLEGIPAVVSAIDVLVIRRGQAIIITFQAGAEIFDQERQRFDQFLSNLDF